MAEYIERGAVLATLCEYCHCEPHCNKNNCYEYMRIKEAPTADVVEVVRCKDCEYYKPQNQSQHWNAVKKYCCRAASIKVQDNDFCSYGKRKGDGNGQP